MEQSDEAGGMSIDLDKPRLQHAKGVLSAQMGMRYDLRRALTDGEAEVVLDALDECERLRAENERLHSRQIRLMELASRADWDENDADA